MRGRDIRVLKFHHGDRVALQFIWLSVWLVCCFSFSFVSRSRLFFHFVHTSLIVIAYSVGGIYIFTILPSIQSESVLPSNTWLWKDSDSDFFLLLCYSTFFWNERMSIKRFQWNCVVWQKKRISIIFYFEMTKTSPQKMRAELTFHRAEAAHRAKMINVIWLSHTHLWRGWQMCLWRDWKRVISENTLEYLLFIGKTISIHTQWQPNGESKEKKMSSHFQKCFHCVPLFRLLLLFPWQITWWEKKRTHKSSNNEEWKKNSLHEMADRYFYTQTQSKKNRAQPKRNNQNDRCQHFFLLFRWFKGITK